MSVRLTREAAAYVRWIYRWHATIDDALIVDESEDFGANAKTVAIVRNAYAQVGEDGLRSLAHVEQMKERREGR